LLTRADLQTQADAIRASVYPRAHGKTFDIATGGSTAEPVTVRRTALTQLFWQATTLRDHLWHRRDLSATMAIIRQFPVKPVSIPHAASPPLMDQDTVTAATPTAGTVRRVFRKRQQQRTVGSLLG
jgi:phenylacetate-CoA ligase